MLTSVRSLMAATVLAGSALVATPAMAQDDSGISISANAAIVSEYRFRGVGLSGGDPAIQGGIDLGTDVGFYIGTWGSSIDAGPLPSLYGEMEWDIYAGWSGDLTDGLGRMLGRRCEPDGLAARRAPIFGRQRGSQQERNAGRRRGQQQVLEHLLTGSRRRRTRRRGASTSRATLR